MILRFDRYELDDELFELRRDGAARPLGGKGFDLLRYLLSSAPRVVTKAELFEQIWDGEHVTEGVLPVTIRSIRMALGRAESEAILKTVRGRGYRVLCRVERTEVVAPPCVAPPSTTTLVGREGVMARLREAYARAEEGEGRATLIFGEAGIGKTRILDEFAAWSRAAGALVLQVRCPDDPGTPPFWPVMQMLREAGHLLGSREFLGRMERSDFDLERARASVRALLQRGLARRVDAAAARFDLTQTVLRLLDRASAIAPVVMVMDDLHCVDEGTAGLCEAIVRSVPDKRALSLSAYRDSELRRGTVLAEVMGSISSLQGTQQLRLRGLERDAVQEFVRAETGTEPSAALVDALCERTEGNPFFLRETLRLLVAECPGQTDGVEALSRLGLAHGIRETVGRRLDKLGSACNDALAWASVIGRRFSFPALAQLCDIDSTRLLEVLGEAEEAHIIVSAPEPGRAQTDHLGTFAFAHGLIRETLYGAMSGPERVLRHRAVAEAIERLHDEMVGDHVFELARHFFEAAPGGDVDRAVEYTLRAARLAQQRSANDDAILHFDQAVRAEQLRVPRDDLRYCCVILGRADALWRAARYARARREFMHGASLALELERFDLLAYALLGMVGWPRFNQLAFGGQEPRVELDAVCDLAQRALAGLSGGDPSLRARLLAVLARIRGADPSASEPETAERVGLAEEALRLARESGDERAVFHALLAKQSALVLPESLEAALPLASEALALAQRLRGPTRLLAAYEARIPLLLMAGDMKGADVDIAAAVKIADELRSPVHRYAARRFELARAVGDGAADRSRALTSHVLALGGQVEDQGARVATDQLMFWMAAVGGSAASLAEAADSIDAELPEDAEGSAMAAYFYMLAGDASKCGAAFDRLAALGIESLRRDGNWLWHLCGCADVAAFLRDRERAVPLHRLISPHARVNVTNRLYCYRGAAAAPLGRLSHLLGRHDEAVRELEFAVAFNRRIGAEPSAVWTECVLATVLLDGSSVSRRRGQRILERVERDAARVGLGTVVHTFLAWSGSSAESRGQSLPD